LEAGFSETTVHHVHNVLHKALKTAVKWGLVSRNVCELVDPPRKAHFEGQALTVEQARKLLTAARGHRMEALFHLELATGMRRGEIMGLKWQDINFEKGLLRVQRILSRVPSKMPGKGYIEAEVKTAKSRRSIENGKLLSGPRRAMSGRIMIMCSVRLLARMLTRHETFWMC
jgi:integrase